MANWLGSELSLKKRLKIVKKINKSVLKKEKGFIFDERLLKYLLKVAKKEHIELSPLKMKDIEHVGLSFVPQFNDFYIIMYYRNIEDNIEFKLISSFNDLSSKEIKKGVRELK